MNKYKAQFGEDRLLDERFGHKTNGYYVEVGAYNGVDLSNTFYFEGIGWTGVLIEADPEMAEVCRAARRNSKVVNCAVVAPDSPPLVTFEVSEECRGLSSLLLDADHRNRIKRFTGRVKIRRVRVPGRTLDSVLQECGSPEIDFMTIDVEGNEWDVLRGFTISRWSPRVLILERNSFFPDRRIINYLHSNGYLFQCTTGVNDWFFPCSPRAAGGLAYKTRFLLISYLVNPLLLFLKFHVADLLARSHLLGRRCLKAVLIRLGLFDRLKSLLEKNQRRCV